MNRKEKNTAHKLFYNEYRMPDKMLYIKKVMDSCTTIEQLGNAYMWGVNVIWKFYDVMCEPCSCIVTLYLTNMTKEISEDLSAHFKVLSKQLSE